MNVQMTKCGGANKTAPARRQKAALKKMCQRVGMDFLLFFFYFFYYFFGGRVYDPVERDGDGAVEGRGE